MKQLTLLCLLAACATQAPAQLNNNGNPERDKDARSTISYGGGGIRGNMQMVADGVLVTESEAKEFQGEAGYHQPLPLRPRAIVPGIEVLKPTPAPDLKLKAPFAIAVQFKPQDAAIIPSSFKVLYGALRFDITERITKHVKVTPEGFSFDKAQIPAGKHKLILQVQDEKQRVAERELRFEVE